MAESRWAVALAAIPSPPFVSKSSASLICATACKSFVWNAFWSLSSDSCVAGFIVICSLLAHDSEQKGRWNQEKEKGRSRIGPRRQPMPAKFALRQYVRKIGQSEVRSVEQISTLEPGKETLYSVQLG